MIGPEVLSHYPKNRLLDKNQETDVQELVKLKVSSKVLRDHASKKYGKNLRLYDIRNMKSRMRLQVNFYLYTHL